MREITLEQLYSEHLVHGFKVLSSSKNWKKRKLTDLVVVCDHPNIEDWDCGCSWGCDLCKMNYKCPDCEMLMANKLKVSVKLKY